MRTEGLLTLFALLIVGLVSCDLRSGIAKKEMEKFETAPTQAVAPQAAGTPIDAAEIVTVDPNLEGKAISIDGHRQNKTAACSKFNRLNINGDDSVIVVTGVCSKVMVNGDRNKITADAAMEFVVNGGENVITYSRFVNGKHPSVIENQKGNVIEKVATQQK
jgi:hypothetical protein